MERAPQKLRPPRVRQIPAGLTAGKGNRKAHRGIRERRASALPIIRQGGSLALPADFVRSGQTVMTHSELQGISGNFFLEAINPSANWSDTRIVVCFVLLEYYAHGCADVHAAARGAAHQSRPPRLLAMPLLPLSPVYVPIRSALEPQGSRPF